MKSNFLRHILRVGIGTLSAQLLTALTLPLLTRLYMPEAYAGWALLMSAVLIVSSISTLRYELAIVLPDSHEEAANVMVGCAGITCVGALIVGLFIPWCAFWVLGETFYNELKGWLWSVPPLIICMASIWPRMHGAPGHRSSNGTRFRNSHCRLRPSSANFWRPCAGFGVHPV